MRVWTIQPKSFFYQLQKDLSISGDVSKIKEQWDYFIPAYDWMIFVMNKRGLNESKSYPIWVWNKKPDKRLSMFKYASDKDYIILELEVSDSEVLWSNFSDWHCVLNDFPLFTDLNQDEKMQIFKKKYGQDCPRMEELDKEDFDKERLNWENIFIQNPDQNEYIQGCIEKVHLSQVKEPKCGQ